ncbi:hypothetical protein GCM10011519_33230 [Marmoricola endophyticus]|uniref:DUF2505 domain-containing protein n=1 Tax=Marmoricola endophyticus TaxID=2040280 RepID=A0A917BS40_9ACTN|nr:DUF2505 domain-containing protein [Marmoricola endophyticus]GGF56677.1 hypothetical protein GCM10011519_33230 [Marmoricola endophyticus]
MSKSIRHEMRYDGATVAQVYAMLADKSFREEVCEFQRVKRHDVVIAPKGGDVANGMDVTVDQVQTPHGIPSFAQKIVGDEIGILQEEDWTSTDQAGLTVAIPGKPGEMTGTITLAEDDGGVTETVAVTAKVSIPLVGGKLEGLITDLLVKALKAENKVGRDYLAR